LLVLVLVLVEVGLGLEGVLGEWGVGELRGACRGVRTGFWLV